MNHREARELPRRLDVSDTSFPTPVGPWHTTQAPESKLERLELWNFSLVVGVVDRRV